MRRHLLIDADQFRRLWHEGLSRTELAVHFRCSVSTVDNTRAELRLPRRKITRHRPKYIETDPTPEEIAERAAECRARHLAEKLREPDVLPTRKWRASLTRSA